MKRLRILVAALLAVSMLLLFGACDKKDDKAVDDTVDDKADDRDETSLYEHGLEVIDIMTEMATNETFLKMYTGNADMIGTLTAIGDGDFSAPDEVFQITASKSAVEKALEMSGFDNMGELSGELRNSMYTRILAIMPTQLNAIAGTHAIAAASACTAGKLFVSSELSGNMIYLYIYEDAAPVMVMFSAGEDGAVSASGTFILNDGADMSSADSIGLLFEELQLNVDVEKLDI